jgi:hypothetical protein
MSGSREVSDALLARQQDAEVQVAQEAQVDAQRRATPDPSATFKRLEPAGRSSPPAL